MPALSAVVKSGRTCGSAAASAMAASDANMRSKIARTSGVSTTSSCSRLWYRSSSQVRNCANTERSSLLGAVPSRR